MILIDTLRPDHLDLYGYGRETAPYLRELGQQSAVFDHAFSTSSWTAPATASLFTGLYPTRHGVVEGLRANRRRDRAERREQRQERKKSSEPPAEPVQTIELNQMPSDLATLASENAPRGIGASALLHPFGALQKDVGDKGGRRNGRGRGRF